MYFETSIILFTSLICLTINGWAQKNIALPCILNDYELDCNDKSNLNNVKGLGQVLWSDDFDDTTLWVIDNDGQSGVDFGWNINSTSEGWWSTGGITSSSGGNYAELVNGRVAMVGFLLLILTEFVYSGNPITKSIFGIC